MSIDYCLLSILSIDLCAACCFRIFLEMYLFTVFIAIFSLCTSPGVMEMQLVLMFPVLPSSRYSSVLG